MQFEEFPKQAQIAIENFKEIINRIIHSNLDNIVYFIDDDKIYPNNIYSSNEFYVFENLIYAPVSDEINIDEMLSSILEIELFGLNNIELHNNAKKFCRDVNYFIPIPEEKYRIYSEDKYFFIANTAKVIPYIEEII